MPENLAKRLIVLTVLVAGCQSASTIQPATPGERLVGAVEEAHGVEAWRAQETVSTDISVIMGGNPVLQGRMLFTPEVGRARLELKDGTVAVFDGERAWVSPPGAPFEAARFHLLAWPYFVAAPFKLRDPGAMLEPLGPQEMQGRRYEAARLTFAPGTGDAPDDWYIVYADPDTHRLEAMAYIVTYWPRPEAKDHPHAITFHDFQHVGGTLLPLHWRFWPWSEQQGAHGEAMGEARLSNVNFVKATPEMFRKPEGAREDPLPSSSR